MFKIVSFEMTRNILPLQAVLGFFKIPDVKTSQLDIYFMQCFVQIKFKTSKINEI